MTPAQKNIVQYAKMVAKAAKGDPYGFSPAWQAAASSGPEAGRDFSADLAAAAFSAAEAAGVAVFD